MNQLHPGARWVFRLNSYSRFGGLFIVLIYLLISTFSLGRKFGADFLFGDSIVIGLVVLIAFFIFCIFLIGEIYARMAYARWRYEINDEGIKLEHGIIWKKYTSVPFERVQNVDIRRGILARTFGFSTVEIETAGSSGMMQYRRGRRGYRSEGHLPAIDMQGAERIREFVIKKIKKNYKDSGL